MKKQNDLLFENVCIIVFTKDSLIVFVTGWRRMTNIIYHNWDVFKRFRPYQQTRYICQFYSKGKEHTPLSTKYKG